MLRKLAVGIVLLFLLSSLSFAIHTQETRYAVEQTTIEQREIVQRENRYGIGYAKPFGGFGEKGSSQGSFGKEGGEEGASILSTNAFIPRGRDPSKISNYYASARGYQIINTYVKLDAVGLELTSRPQINGSPEGHARIINRRPNELYLPQGTVILRTRDLVPLRPYYIYEAWLVDEDTGSSMSIGLLQPSEIGRIAELAYTVTGSFEPFESIVVTTEPFPDDNPMPGQVVLAGSIKEKNVRTP